MAKRAHISVTTKLAAALLTIRRPNENGELVPVIAFEEAQKLTAAQIISRFEFNHYPIPHALGGPDAPWNLEPLPKAEHRQITADVDIPRIAKVKKISKAEEEFRRRLLAKTEPPAFSETTDPDLDAGRRERRERRSKWPKRSFGRKTTERRNG
ncbi:HNH endonuclease [Rhodopseudomonas palustris]|nr:HNH endonuclease [Rhodopseudomonas palustris]